MTVPRTTLFVPPFALALAALHPGWAAWLGSKPQVIQATIRRFPPGTHGVVQGELVWVVGYGEGETPDGPFLILSTVSPFDPGFDPEQLDPDTIRRAHASHFEPQELELS